MGANEVATITLGTSVMRHEDMNAGDDPLLQATCHAEMNYRLHASKPFLAAYSPPTAQRGLQVELREREH